MKNLLSILTILAFALPVMAEVTTPVAYDATDVTHHTMTAHWSACPGATSYNLRTYPIQLEGLVFREKFDNCTPNDVYEESESGDISLNGYADHNGWWGYGLQGTYGGIVINNGCELSLYGNETDLKIYPYVKKRTIKFKARAYEGDSDCKVMLVSGSTEMTVDLTPEEKWYTMVVERTYPNYFGMLYMGCMFKNITYEPGNNRVVLTDFKVYWGDYSEPQAQSLPPTGPAPKDMTVEWNGDTTFVKNIPSDSTSLTFYPGTPQYHYIDDFTYWHYDVQAVYDDQVSDWSNQIVYTLSPWPEFLEYVDDDDPIVNPVVGDVNGDGEVNTVDITILYNYILNGETEGMVNGDQDGDGAITSVDVTVVYNVLLGVEQ